MAITEPHPVPYSWFGYDYTDWEPASVFTKLFRGRWLTDAEWLREVRTTSVDFSDIKLPQPKPICFRTWALWIIKQPCWRMGRWKSLT